MYAHLNRYSALCGLEDTDVSDDMMDIDQEEALTASPPLKLLPKPTKNSPRSMNMQTLSTKHRKKRERKAKNGPAPTVKQMDRDRKTRRIRDSKAHRRLGARIRKAALDGAKGAKVLNSFGSWMPRKSMTGTGEAGIIDGDQYRKLAHSWPPTTWIEKGQGSAVFGQPRQDGGDR